MQRSRRRRAATSIVALIRVRSRQRRPIHPFTPPLLRLDPLERYPPLLPKNQQARSLVWGDSPFTLVLNLKPICMRNPLPLNPNRSRNNPNVYLRSFISPAFSIGIPSLPTQANSAAIEVGSPSKRSFEAPSCISINLQMNALMGSRTYFLLVWSRSPRTKKNPVARMHNDQGYFQP